MNEDEQTLTARWVLPVNGEPIPQGMVRIAKGRIAAVEKNKAATPDIDLGNSAIIPGLVNAHTHLDLSHMLGLAPPSQDFTGWLSKVIEFRRRQTSADTDRAVQTGIGQCISFGTTLVGDIAAQGISVSALRRAPLWALVFYEVIGLSLDRGRASWQSALDWIGSMPGQDNCRVGISPHAPYSVNKTVFLQAAKSLVPIAMHVGESEAEMRFIESRTGPFMDFLRSVGAWDETGVVSDLREVVDNDNGKKPVLLVHANYLASRRKLLRNQTIVHCPRTHQGFERPVFPLKRIIDSGTRVALGTDSLASNPDLDVLAEASCVAREHPELDKATVLRMATLWGAEALGYGADCGSLEPGKSADLAVIPLPDADDKDPHTLLFEYDKAETQIRRSMWRGNWREAL
jgi:cytosine/adenosine deaminase-related metal-dependent hydrolase